MSDTHQRRPRLMCILAHPDDESLGFGGTLARYAAEGVETHLVTATRGEKGWFGSADEYPGPSKLGRLRESELRQAAQRLGIVRVDFLDYVDGELREVDAGRAIDRLVTLIRSVQPDVVLTFGPDGAYGHPDHIAISQFTMAATICAADSCYSDQAVQQPHRITKLYYRVWNDREQKAYDEVFGKIAISVDGDERTSVCWPAWTVTTRIDTADYWQTVWQAVKCHRSQMPGYELLEALTEDVHRRLWGQQRYFRVFSTVDCGVGIEDDLFAGTELAVVETGKKSQG